MRKRLLSLFLTLTICMGLAIPAFADEGKLEHSLYISNPSTGTIQATYEGKQVTAVTYPAGTVFTFDFDSKLPRGYDYCTISRDGEWVITLGYIGGWKESFTLPDDDAIYEFTFAHSGSGVPYDPVFFYVAVGGAAPVQPEVSSGDITLPNDPTMPGVTMTLSNVLDTYKLELEGRGVVTVYRIQKTGSTFTIASGNTVVYPGWCGCYMPKNGKFVYDVENGDFYIGQMGNMWGASGTNTCKLTLGSYEPADNVFLINVGQNTMIYYTYADHSAYDKNPGTSNAATGSGFADVSAAAYYCEPVQWAVEKAITTGTTTTTFSPDATCTNAQILTFMWRAAGSPEPVIGNPFINLDSSAYYAKAAVWAYENGMISGSTFDADKPCTRAMTMEYFWKQAGSPVVSIANKFNDVAPWDSYAQAVGWAVAKGITTGATADTFAPNNTCTRAQIVTFLYRAMK